MDAVYLWVENAFRSLARLVYRHPVLFLSVTLFLALGLASQLGKLKVDVSNEGFFHDDSPEIINYEAFREQFGREDILYISVAPPEVFAESFLKRLKQFHSELESTVPHLDEVTSLLNARNTRGELDELIVEDLFEHWPADDAEMTALKQRAMANPFYRDLLLSADGRITAVVVRASPWAENELEEDVLGGFDLEVEAGSPTTAGRQFMSAEENAEFVDSALQVVEKYDSEDFPLAVSGVPVITESVKAGMRRDFGRFVIGSLLVSIVLLSLLFRRFSGTLLPLLVIFLTLFSTLGLMGLTGTAFKVQTQVLPSFLMAVSIAAAVHILSQFYRHFDSGDDRETAIVDAMGHSGAPVLGAGITTAVGMLSFSNAGIAPLADLGVFAGLGILLSLAYTLMLLPALLALLPLRPRPVGPGTTGIMDWVLGFLAEFSIARSRLIIIACLVGSVVAVWGLSRLVFYHEVLAWFPEDYQVRSDTYLIDRQLNGVQSFELVLDTGVENGLYEPDMLAAMESLGAALTEMEAGGLKSGKTVSLVDVVKEINLALNAGDPAFYRLPEDRQLVAQELFLFENTGTDDLEDLVDSQFSKARFTVKIPWSDATSMDAYYGQLQAQAREILPPDVQVTVTGISSLYAHIVQLTKTSMIQSYLIAVALISVLMVLFIGDLKLGLLAMIPNLSPILLTLAAMGILGVNLTVFSMFIGSIALGLAVDDTLHFFHGFKRYHEATGDTEEAIRLTFHSTGRALTVTTVALTLGFFIFAFATMEAVKVFGVFTGLALLLALFGDFVLTPALFKELIPDRESPPAATTTEGFAS
jgi:uncharacterized protein